MREKIPKRDFERLICVKQLLLNMLLKLITLNKMAAVVTRTVINYSVLGYSSIYATDK